MSDKLGVGNFGGNLLAMINCGERDEVFYDSVDSLSTFDEESACGFWRNDLQSVKERREAFLCLLSSVDSVGLSSERISECTQTASSFSTTVCNETVEVPIYCEREDNGQANVMVDESESDLSSGSSPAFDEDPTTLDSSESKEDDCRGISSDKNRALNWWKKKRRVMSKFLSMQRKASSSRRVPEMSKVDVQVKKKKWKELSALYVDQEFRAHEGVVWTAKFSPDGQYLATGGQDGVLRVWLVASADAHHKPFLDSCYGSKGGKAGVRAEKTLNVPVVIPDRIFQIEELPVQEFCGHSGDILDLAWSNSNLILSSSSDKTVRLWHIGSNECLGVYRHSSFVTCVQFNPIDDGYFISGSLDGKIRVWTVSEGRVFDWDDARDAVTAISYQPDGEGLVVGCLNGCCRFYKAPDCSLQLITHIQLPRNKKSSGNRISGIQFCQDHSQRVIITSEDSKIRIFDKTELIQKYRGLPKSRAQMSASVTPNERHIISVGEDSRVYLWDYDHQQKTNEKHSKSIRSCEYFCLQGVSVVVPWCGYSETSYSGCAMPCCSRAPPHQDASRVSIPNWLAQEGSLRVTATWPEEMLPLQDSSHYQGLYEQQTQRGGCSPTWGLVLVAATCDGMIRVLHNYGLFPVKVEANVLSNLR